MTSDRMEVELEVIPNVAPAASPSLLEWLQSDPGLRSTLRPRPSPPSPGELGASGMVLAGLITPATLASLIGLARAWMELQRNRVKVRISSQYSEITLDLAKGEDPQQIVSEFLRAAGKMKAEP